MKPAVADLPELEVADRVYRSYARTRPHHPAPRSAAELLRGPGPTFRKRFAPLLPRAKDARIADLGCGYGEFLYFLQQEGYRNTCGIDLDRAHVDASQSLGVRNVRCGDAREFLRSACDYDVISALDVVEHFPKAEVLDFFELVRGALRPGGRFLCQVPNLAGFHTPLFFMDFTHQTPFTGPSLKQALEIAGFVKVRVFGLGPVAHGLRSAARCLLWRGISATLRATQTIEGGPRDSLSSIFTASIAAIAERP